MGRDSMPWYRKSKRAWYVWEGGRQVRLHADKDEALRLWHARKAGGHAAPAPGDSPSLPSLIDSYLAHVKATQRPATLLLKEKTLLRLKGVGGPASAFTADAAVRWVESQARWGRSRRWIAGVHIRAMFAWNKTPLPPLKLPGALSRGASCLVSDADHRRLVETAPPCYAAALRFLYATGCRPSELSSVTAAGVAGGVVVIEEHKTSKSGRARLIVLTGEALAGVEGLMRERPSGPLFLDHRGRPLGADALRYWLRDHCKRLGIRVSLVGYRHRFATDALARGVPDALVAQLLGHADTRMLFTHYAHLSARVQALREAAERARPAGGEGPLDRC